MSLTLKQGEELNDTRRALEIHESALTEYHLQVAQLNAKLDDARSKRDTLKRLIEKDRKRIRALEEEAAKGRAE